MENKKEKLEDFKTAISSTVRSITNSTKIEISFGAQVTKSKKNSIKLPDLTHISNKINYEEIRAVADSKSLNLYSSNFACSQCGYAIPELEPRMFSFNNPYGACSRCDGLVLFSSSMRKG